MNKENDTKDLFHQLFGRARIMYNFTNLMSTHTKHTNCSTIAPELSMTEVHLLVDILENPGITVSDLGRMNQKTRGAISQMTTKLETSGLLEKKVSTQHAKKMELYLTESGHAIATEHVAFDVRALTATLNQLLLKCTMDEINSFYKVMQCYNEILQDELT